MTAFGATWGPHMVKNCSNWKNKIPRKLFKFNLNASSFFWKKLQFCSIWALQKRAPNKNFTTLVLCLNFQRKYQLIVFSQSWDNRGQNWGQTDRVSKSVHHIIGYVIFFLVKICHLPACFARGGIKWETLEKISLFLCILKDMFVQYFGQRSN
jgi:hypothetical protein